MRKVLWVVFFALLLSGCDWFKGDKGDDGDKGDGGDDGLLRSKRYAGVTTANPHKIIFSTPIDLSKDVVEVYRCNSTDYTSAVKAKLPWTVEYSESHVYAIENSNAIKLLTTWETVMPTYALSSPDGSRFTYEIYVRTFNTTSAAIAYKKSLSSSPDKSTYGNILYGVDR